MKTLRKIVFLLTAALILCFAGCDYFDFGGGNDGSGGGRSSTIVGKWGPNSTTETFEITSDWRVVIDGSDEKITYTLKDGNITTWEEGDELGTASYTLSNSNNTLTLSNVGNSRLTAGTYIRFGSGSGGGGGGGGTLSAPTGVTAARNPAGSATVLVSWNAVSGATSYRVYWSTTGSGSGNLDGTSYTTSFTSAGNTTTSTWYFRVTAVNSAGEGPASSWVSVGPATGGGGGATLPSAPTGVTAVRNPAGSSTVLVTWNTVSGATSYRVYYSTSGSGSGSLDGTSYETSFNSVGNTTTSTWYFSVSAVNSAGESPRSSWVLVGPVSSNSGTGTESNPITLSDGLWHDGTVSIGGTVWYQFSVSAGSTYYVWWNDSHEGDGTKTLDIEVTFYWPGGNVVTFNDGSTAQDSGWNTGYQLTTGSNGYIKMKVEPYSYDSGTFGIVYRTTSSRP